VRFRLPPLLGILHEWLDSRSGIGVIEQGMARQGYDLQLTRYAKATGFGLGTTLWRAVQRAA
jgi:hypothetical protein